MIFVIQSALYSTEPYSTVYCYYTCHCNTAIPWARHGSWYALMYMSRRLASQSVDTGSRHCTSLCISPCSAGMTRRSMLYKHTLAAPNTPAAQLVGAELGYWHHDSVAEDSTSHVEMRCRLMLSCTKIDAVMHRKPMPSNGGAELSWTASLYIVHVLFCPLGWLGGHEIIRFFTNTSTLVPSAGSIPPKPYRLLSNAGHGASLLSHNWNS